MLETRKNELFLMTLDKDLQCWMRLRRYGFTGEFRVKAEFLQFRCHCQRTHSNELLSGRCHSSDPNFRSSN